MAKTNPKLAAYLQGQRAIVISLYKMAKLSGTVDTVVLKFNHILRHFYVQQMLYEEIGDDYSVFKVSKQ